MTDIERLATEDGRALGDDANWHPFAYDDSGAETNVLHACCRNRAAVLLYDDEEAVERLARALEVADTTPGWSGGYREHAEAILVDLRNVPAAHAVEDAERRLG